MEKKKDKDVVQQAILNTDTTVEKNAPDKNKTSNTTKVSKGNPSKPISKSRKRTSLEEFAITNNLRPEVKAGFKAWLKGEYFHFDNEWNELYTQYKNR